MRGQGRRIIFDVTTSFRWRGPPAGIVRVERNFALWALNNLRNVTFVIFDSRQDGYYELTWDLQAVLDGAATFLSSRLAEPVREGGRKTNALPLWLRPLVLWVRNRRRILLGRLELVRLQAKWRALARLVGILQFALMTQKYRDVMVAADGSRLPFLRQNAWVGGRVDCTTGDVLVSVGAGWDNTNIGAIRELKARGGFCFILLCHDLIPLLFPHFYKSIDVDAFRAYMHEALALADLVVVTSQKGEQDCRAYCQERGVKVPKMAISPLGFDGPDPIEPVSSTIALPNGLVRGRFAMMVSTIEPRKGHQLLYRVWRRLVEEGIAQANGFKLAFVGRRGWMVDELISQIVSDRTVSGQIEIIHDVSDRQLRSLYAGAAFCVFPSKYEGYGLPICEAFAHGRTVIASTGGAIPEIVGTLSPCLDPDDDEVWYETIKEWIQSPTRRLPYEQAIKRQFKHPTWREAAANFFAISDCCAREHWGHRRLS